MKKTLFVIGGFLFVLIGELAIFGIFYLLLSFGTLRWIEISWEFARFYFGVSFLIAVPFGIGIYFDDDF